MDEVDLLCLVCAVLPLWLSSRGCYLEAFGTAGLAILTLDSNYSLARLVDHQATGNVDFFISFFPLGFTVILLSKILFTSLFLHQSSRKRPTNGEPQSRGGVLFAVNLALLMVYFIISIVDVFGSFDDYAWLLESRRNIITSALVVVLVASVSSIHVQVSKLIHILSLYLGNRNAPDVGAVRLSEDPINLLESLGDTESDEEYATVDSAQVLLRRLSAHTAQQFDSPELEESSTPILSLSSEAEVSPENHSVEDFNAPAEVADVVPSSRIHAEPSRRGGIPVSSPARVVLATSDMNSEVSIATTIKHYGHNCTVVRNAAALMERVRKEDFDIAIVDLSLPDYDRIIMKELKNPKLIHVENGESSLQSQVTPSQPNIVVVGLAGDVSESVRSRVIQEGIVDLMSKPPSDLMIDTVIRSVPCEPAPPPAKVGSQRAKSLQPHQKKPTLLKMNTTGNFLTTATTKPASAPSTAKPLPLSKAAAPHATLLKKGSLNKTTPTTSPHLQRPETTEEIEPSTSTPSSSSLTEFATVEDRLRQENARLHEKVSNLKQQLQQTQRTLDAVIPPEYQQHIARNRHLVLGKVACRPLTIMFSDIRNFSRQAESMSVDALMEFVNSWLSFALPPVSDHGGFVDKFIGDSIMCIFAHDDIGSSAIESVRAAVEMMRSLDYMKGLQGLFSCDTGVGINTGKCMMGVLGIETRMEPTVLGDAVNLASRTESLTKKYGARVLITEHTKAHLGAKESEWVIRLVDHVYVVGKTFPVRLYEVVDGEPPEVRQKKTGFIENGWWTTAIAQFEAGHFGKALQFFQKCLHVYPLDIPSRIYVQRCHDNLQPHFDINTWQAIYPLDSK